MAMVTGMAVLGDRGIILGTSRPRYMTGVKRTGAMVRVASLMTIYRPAQQGP